MKKFMKKGLILTLILVCIASIFALSACGYKSHKGEKTINLIIGEGETQEVFSSYNTDAEFLYDVLKEFNDEEYLTIKTSGSGDMIFITELGDLKPDATKNEYIAILCDLKDYQSIGDWVTTKIYKETTLVTASFGCAMLPVIDGGTYMLILASY